MSARHKLNRAALNGAFVVAGIIALAANSWLVFWILAAVLTVSAIHAGDIRLGRRGRR